VKTPNPTAVPTTERTPVPSVPTAAPTTTELPPPVQTTPPTPLPF
jgi:hypothetical protein